MTCEGLLVTGLILFEWVISAKIHIQYASVYDLLTIRFYQLLAA